MINKLNEKKSFALVIAAVITSLTVMLAGTISGLVLAVRVRKENAALDNGRTMAQYLLLDAAGNLAHSMSALRLCVDAEPAEELNRMALVHAVRAETALECHVDDWADSRSKEAFLNDIATVLHTYTPERTIEMSDELYRYAAEFYASVESGGEFTYDGELVDGGGNDDVADFTQAEISAAKEVVRTALDTEYCEYAGAWGGHIEFNVVRGGQTGYAVVCGEKVAEFAFVREDGEDQTDVDEAKKIALETAKKCGYDLVVKWGEVTGKSVSVIMCKDYDGAKACDDRATAVVYGGKVVAFTAGECDCEHKDIPSVKKTEREASRSAVGGGQGTLVVRKLGGRERVCYEYRYELEDGVHYVYVCAENGKQIQVK